MSYSRHTFSTDYTRQICKYIMDSKFEDFSPLVMERARMMSLHCVGVSLCASELPPCQDAIAIAKEMSPGNEGVATLWADGAKVSLEAAGFAAGFMGDTLDWEDCAWTGHPTSGVVPAALIAGEVFHKSGKEVLTAIVVGYEVYQRIGLAVGMSNLPGLNIWAGLIPMMKLADLSLDQMNQAISLGTACAIIPGNVHECTMADNLNYEYGFRMEAAARIINTVKAGISNMENALDDPTAFFDHGSTPSVDWLCDGLGSAPMFMTSMLCKRWPANVFVQTYAELAYRIVEKYHPNPDDIESIILRPSVKFRHWYPSEKGYKSTTQAQFSIPYGVACCFYHPEPGAVWAAPDTMTDPKIIALANKVKADGFVNMKIAYGSVDPNAKKVALHIKDYIEGAHPEKHIIVRLKDGTEYTTSLFTHPGHPYYMMMRDEFVERFHVETKYVLPVKKQNKVADMISHLEEYDDVAELARWLY